MFATKFHISPKEVDELGVLTVEKMAFIESVVQEKLEREQRRAHG